MFCGNCGQKLLEGDRFCGKCGTPILQTDRSNPTSLPTPPPPSKPIQREPSSILTQQSSPKIEPRFAKRIEPTAQPYTLRSCLGFLLLVVSIGAGVAVWYNLDDKKDAQEKIQSAQSTHEKKPDPYELPLIESDAVDLTPAEGLHITAPANTFEKNKTITATRFDDKELDSCTSKINPNSLPLAAYHLDAGLKRGEKLSSPATLSFDLQKLGIPKEIWKYLSVVRVDEEGSRTTPAASVNENALVCNTKQNSSLIIIVPLLVIGVPCAIMNYDDKTAKFNYLGDTNFSDSLGNYTVYWSGSLGVKNPAECQRVNTILKTLQQKHQLLTQDGKPTHLSGRDRTMAYKMLCADTLYTQTYNLTIRRSWKEKYLWPDRVTLAIDALLKADEYLMDVRKFDRPEVIYDVLVLEKWPAAYSSTALGLCVSPVFNNAFLALNVSNEIFGYSPSTITPKGNVVPAKTTKTVESVKDGMNVTVVHELFHCLQDSYLTLRKNAYLWFFEAEAVTLEYEADVYYVSKGWNKSHDILTDRDSWPTLRQPLPDPGDVAGDIQKHGYTLSQFFEVLRDDKKFNRNGDLVKNVQNAFKSCRQNTISALYTGCGATAEELSKQFLDFCREPARAQRMFNDVYDKLIHAQSRTTTTPELFNRMSEELYVHKQVDTWALPGIRPLSIDYHVLTFTGVPPQILDESVLHIVAPFHGEFEAAGVFHDTKAGDMPFKPLGTLATHKCKAHPHVTIKRIDTNTAQPWLGAGSLELKIYLMLPPAIPKLAYSNGGQLLKITFPHSVFKGMMIAHEVYLNAPGQSKPITIQAPANTPIFEIDLSNYTKIGGKLEGLSNTQLLDVRYAENIVLPDRDEILRGPPSKKISGQALAAKFIEGRISFKFPYQYRVTGSVTVSSQPQDSDFNSRGFENTTPLVWSGLTATITEKFEQNLGIPIGTNPADDRGPAPKASTPVPPSPTLVTTQVCTMAFNQSGSQLDTFEIHLSRADAKPTPTRFVFKNIPQVACVEVGNTGIFFCGYALNNPELKKQLVSFAGKETRQVTETDPKTQKPIVSTVSSEVIGVLDTSGGLFILLTTHTDAQIKALLDAKKVTEQELNQTMTKFGEAIGKYMHH